ncbi:MAG: hypothetical protein JNM18_09970 [Planctomycetaceae bacterium]|nr:hypothetical protein [Planctomycetaceae bacterium]
MDQVSGSTPPFPFIVIDQNQLRDRRLLAELATRGQKQGLQLLVPEGAFFELSKSKKIMDTWRNSLQLLYLHRTSVCISDKMTRLMNEEIIQQEQASRIDSKAETTFVRSILEQINSSDYSTIQEIIDGPLAEKLPRSLLIWNDHDNHKSLVTKLQALMKESIPPDLLKKLRQSPETAAKTWLCSISGARFVFQGIKSFGADDSTALLLTREPSVNGAFLCAVAGLAVNWIANGGLESAKPRSLTNDLHDIEYIVFGSLCDSLASEDSRAINICTAVKESFSVRSKMLAVRS